MWIFYSLSSIMPFPQTTCFWSRRGSDYKTLRRNTMLFSFLLWSLYSCVLPGTFGSRHQPSFLHGCSLQQLLLLLFFPPEHQINKRRGPASRRSSYCLRTCSFCTWKCLLLNCVASSGDTNPSIFLGRITGNIWLAVNCNSQTHATYLLVTAVTNRFSFSFLSHPISFLWAWREPGTDFEDPSPPGCHISQPSIQDTGGHCQCSEIMGDNKNVSPVQFFVFTWILLPTP